MYPTEEWDIALNLREMGSTQGGGMREGTAPQTESKISRQLPAGKESPGPWSKKTTERRVRHDKEDPSCTEWALLDIPCKCYLVMRVNIINIIRLSCILNSLSYLIIYFRRINHMAINHLHSSSYAMSLYVTVASGTVDSDFALQWHCWQWPCITVTLLTVAMHCTMALCQRLCCYLISDKVLGIRKDGGQGEAPQPRTVLPEG